MKSLKFIFSVFLIFIFIAPVYAQLKDFKFEHISTNLGLSESNVTCILQDNKGFMWFGTRDGLNKYDGYNFTVYKNDSDNKNSLSNNTIREIVQDAKGNIWIATWGGGLCMFDQEKEKFVSYKNDKNNPHSLSDNFINNVLVDNDENIWIGTYTGGLNFFDRKTGRFTHFNYNKDKPNTISDNNVTKLFQDENDDIWIGTVNGGLNHFNRKENKFTILQHNPNDGESISSDRIRTIFKDSKNNFWIGTYGGGLDLLDLKTLKFEHHKKDPANNNSICHNAIFAIEEDDQGNLWIGTENGGLSIYNPNNKTFQNYENNKFDNTSLSNNSIYSIKKDKKGNIWIGTFSGGLDFVNSDAFKFTHYRQNANPNSLSNNNVLSIFEDSEDNLWIATDGGGLNLFDRKKGDFKHYKHDEKNKNSLCGNYVLGVFEDSKGNIWASTWGDGVSKFNKKTNTFTNFKHDSKDTLSLSSDNVWLVYEDKQENIWIGTFGGGLSLYNPTNETFQHFQKHPNDPQTIASDYIYYIYEDSKNNLWIGTDGGGLNLFDRKTRKFRHFLKEESKNSISNNSVNCIYEDTKGRLWVSTDAGLNIMDRENFTFESYFTKDGLPNNMTFGILEDSDSNFWIATNNGLSKFNPEAKLFTNYSIADGLQHNEFKRLAFCKSKNGMMYFGGINGFNEFIPEQVKEKSFDPPLLITSFQLFNKHVPVKDSLHPNSPLEKHITDTKSIVLSYKESVISFEFASLNYTIPEKKKYAYLLEGFDKEWNDVGIKRTASYTNLDPGEYVFKVKGLNNEGQWSENMALLTMSITPPFWKTWWFKIIALATFFGSVFSVYQARINIIKNQKVALEKQVQERTAEVVSQKEELEAQSEKMEELYTEIKDSIRAAQNIQQSILPTQNYIRKYIPQTFVLNKPKDVVSGDFYWFNEVDDQFILAVVDCTGHGVSGAFMSINGHHLLNQSIYGQKDLKASEILNRLNLGVIKELHQEDEDSEMKDGMDVALCIIDKDKKRLQYAGANNPLYLIRNRELIQVKANKFSVGLSVTGKINSFNNNEIALQEEDILYIFSDGYADQLGGESGYEKFMYQKFRKLLLDIHQHDLDRQASELDEAITKWMGKYGQIDDIMVIGFRI